MKNRFNINEEEKNRIKVLHGIGIIKEQWTEVKLDEVQDEVEEGAKPDFLDLDKDGDKKESMKKAAKEVKEDHEELEEGSVEELEKRVDDVEDEQEQGITAEQSIIADPDYKEEQEGRRQMKHYDLEETRELASLLTGLRSWCEETGGGKRTTLLNTDDGDDLRVVEVLIKWCKGRK